MSGTERRPAAVILGIYEKPPHGVIFIERSQHLPSHAGQIALPGGGADASDAGDLRVTALREMWEEVAIEASRVTILGELPVVRARTNNYAVTPFVATIAPGEAPRIDGDETVGVFTVPLQMILDELHDGPTRIGAFDIVTPVVDYGDKHIWGLTGHILRTFVDAWRGELRDSVERRFRPA